ncbi:SPOR domain-containing protein [Sphingomonas sp. CFBP 13603]|uniref:tetratricopeptide repeat protein n=1 Tax=Sphingomonas sp. CFBP 13603 TaxID=2774040 RepID=UPI001865E506|nr:SPOR domain-containing protein [Sphingomonas sp. CFBP 13603]MBE2990654.1 SPOR domain-containing protein [Sphingomonas sp. CFBP 13603]
MTRSSHHLLTAALALVLAAVPAAASAQAVVQAIPGTTDADKLGDVMRQLASNPRNIDALIKAGDLSMGLGDLSGAAALFARAEKVNPRDGRAKAGMASILVRSERPGEALRYYAQAEGLGLDPRNFAADRGLAYDLIGQQDRAQRDYRVALRDAPDDETTRRYALSLGISGKPELAVQQLNPLLLKSDRGAWRSRAFILAMNGDVAGAEKIATTMMPAGTAQGLQPFFQRLPNLPASDRAFAVHFGEVHATPARLADARMAPPLGVLAADPTAPVMMAAVTPQPAVTAKTGKKDKRDRRSNRDRVQMAAVTRPSSTPVPVTTSAPVPPVATPSRTLTTVPAPSTYAAPVQLAATPMQMVQPLPARTVQPVPQPSYSAPTVTLPGARTNPAAETNSVVSATLQPSASPVARTVPAPSPAGTLPPRVATQMAAISVGQTRADPTRTANTLAASAAAAPSVSPLPTPIQQAPVQQVAPTQSASAETPTPGFTSSSMPAPVAATLPPRTHAVAASEDSILARIVAGLSIPASELDVAPMHPAPVVTPATIPVSDDSERVLAEAKAKTERDAAAKAIAAKTLAADKLAADKKAALDKKAAAKKAIADKKALAEKKAAAAEKLAADKAAAEEKRIARANPARTWVQVSTGATEGDLPKAWKKAKAKAPTVFGARGGWTAPWKATNRVLAGPFKTDAEARTFVNQLAKEGVSTFTFTSDPGEIITKLPAK